MSFMSGIMMGASLGSTIHEALTGGSRRQAAPAVMPVARGEGQQVPEFALVSSLQGRRRYRLAVLAANPALCRYLEEALGGMMGMGAVSANEATGSLLLEYTASEEKIDRLMEGIRQRLAPVSGSVQAGQPGQAGNLAGQGTALVPARGQAPTIYARSWSSTGAFLNRQVRQLTCNSFDISALISLFFLIRGIRKMLVYGQRPSGPSMIWWALHLMKGWRK
ncbi:MAG: HMA2 domain-containing protein [Anaerovibrio sp.]